MKAATVSATSGLSFNFISIHAAREGGDGYILRPRDEYIISIHAAREGGDTIAKQLNRLIPISIHAAREGGDALYNDVFEKFRHFNPRRP